MSGPWFDSVPSVAALEFTSFANHVEGDKSEKGEEESELEAQ